MARGPDSTSTVHAVRVLGLTRTGAVLVLVLAVLASSQVRIHHQSGKFYISLII